MQHQSCHGLSAFAVLVMAVALTAGHFGLAAPATREQCLDTARGLSITQVAVSLAPCRNGASDACCKAVNAFAGPSTALEGCLCQPNLLDILLANVTGNALARAAGVTAQQVVGVLSSCNIPNVRGTGGAACPPGGVTVGVNLPGVTVGVNTAAIAKAVSEAKAAPEGSLPTAAPEAKPGAPPQVVGALPKPGAPTPKPSLPVDLRVPTPTVQLVGSAPVPAFEGKPAGGPPAPPPTEEEEPAGEEQAPEGGGGKYPFLDKHPLLKQKLKNKRDMMQQSASP